MKHAIWPINLIFDYKTALLMHKRIKHNKHCHIINNNPPYSTRMEKKLAPIRAYFS